MRRGYRSPINFGYGSPISWLGNNAVAPVFQSASINAAGTSLVVLFDINVVNSGGFTALVNGVSSSLSSAVVLNNQITYTINTVYPGDVVTLSYTPGNIKDAGTETAALAAFGATAVTNNSTADFYSALGNQQLALLATEAYTDTTNTTLATANADVIASLKDMSGNSRHAQNATSGNRPVLQIVGGRKAVKFIGTASKTLTTTSFLDSTYNGTFTMYLVKEFHGVAGPKVLVGGQSTTMFIADAKSSTPGPEFDWYTNGNGARDFAYSDGNIVAACLQFNGTTKRVEVYAITGSGMVVTSSATFSLGLSGALTIGDISQGGGFAWAGFFYALRLYKANHSTGTITSVLDRLRLDYQPEPTAATYVQGAGTKSVLTDGDSLTVGQASTTNNDYPTRLGVGLGAGYTVTKGLAVGGQTVGEMNADAETQMDALYSASYTHNIIAAWGGTNDMFFGLPATVAYRRYRDYCLRRKAKGFKVIAFTILPRTDAGVAGGFEVQRQAFNTLVRNNYLQFADGLADVAADSRIGDAGDELNTTYYHTDKVHLIDAGYQIIADIVKPVVQALAA